MDYRNYVGTKFASLRALGRTDAAREAQGLRDGIHYHDFLYYVKRQPKIRDALYDRLLRRLRELEAAFPELETPDSPTRRLDGEVMGRPVKVRHAAPLLRPQASLQRSEVESFLEATRDRSQRHRVCYCLEPEYTGVPVAIAYGDGRFQYGATRGNGLLGEDVSHHLKAIRTVPLVLQHRNEAPHSLTLRGEVFLPRPAFAALNQQRTARGRPHFSTPAQAAAALLRRQAARPPAGSGLEIVFYDILASDGALPGQQHELLLQLARWGLKTSPWNEISTTFKGIEAYHRRLGRHRDELDFDIDGIIIKVDDHGLRSALGNRGRAPCWAFAWKFPPRRYGRRDPRVSATAAS